MAVSLLWQISLTESRAEKPLAVNGPPFSGEQLQVESSKLQVEVPKAEKHHSPSR